MPSRHALMSAPASSARRLSGRRLRARISRPAEAGRRGRPQARQWFGTAARRNRARARARHGLRRHRAGRRIEDPAEPFRTRARGGAGSPTGRSWRSPNSSIRACRRSPTRCRPGSAAGCSHSGWPRRLFERFTKKGRVVKTSTICGFLQLYFVAALKPTRRRSLRFQNEQAFLEAWLQENPRRGADQLRARGRDRADPHAGQGLQRHPRARPRALRHADADACRASRRLPDPAATLAKLRKAALADDTGAALNAAIKDIRPLPQAAE